jgi:hypothetical protein
MNKTFTFDERNGSGTLTLSAFSEEDAKKQLAEKVKEPDAWRFGGQAELEEGEEDCENCKKCGETTCGNDTKHYSCFEPIEETPAWIEKHSVNCIKCNDLFDERDGTTPEDGEGTLCPNCDDKEHYIRPLYHP